MGKFLKSLTNGSLRCKYCGDTDCNCMEDGATAINIIAIYKYSAHPFAWLVHLAKQKLPNGKKIPSGTKIWIPTKNIHSVDDVLKKIGIDNDFLNKLRFD
jgi:hypothetical protein